MSDLPPPLARRVAELEARVAALLQQVEALEVRLATTGTVTTGGSYGYPRSSTGHPPAWPL